MIRRSGSLALALGAALCGAACGREEPRAEVAADTEVVVPVAAEAARRGNLRAIIRTTGVVTAAAGSEFIAAATEPARILEIPKAEGDRVARGDPDRLEVTAPIPAADASRVLPGATARVTSIAGTSPLRLTVASRPWAPEPWRRRPTAGGSGGDALVRLTFAEPTTIAVDTRGHTGLADGATISVDTFAR